MRTNLQNKVARYVLGAFLSSSFSDEELLQIANDFTQGTPITREIGNALSNLLQDNKSRKLPADIIKGEKRSQSKNSLVNEALSIIKQKRLSKIGVIGRMGAISPDAANYFKDRIEMPLLEILELFFKNESKGVQIAFLEMLDGKRGDDEYLKGIMREKP